MSPAQKDRVETAYTIAFVVLVMFFAHSLWRFDRALDRFIRVQLGLEEAR